MVFNAFVVAPLHDFQYTVASLYGVSIYSGLPVWHVILFPWGKSILGSIIFWIMGSEHSGFPVWRFHIQWLPCIAFYFIFPEQVNLR